MEKNLGEWSRPNGLKIQKVSIPLGVIGVIYESRPNVAADAAGLCLKSGNALILRGGSEDFNSSSSNSEDNQTIHEKSLVFLMEHYKIFLQQIDQQLEHY